MKTSLFCLALLVGQIDTLQSKSVVHLQPHRNSISVESGGQLLELINAPFAINLPLSPPKADSAGIPWSIDVKNLGPSVVTVADKAQFSVHINVGQTVHIYSNGTVYSLKR
jgi:hypothetical protein